MNKEETQIKSPLKILSYLCLVAFFVTIIKKIGT